MKKLSPLTIAFFAAALALPAAADHDYKHTAEYADNSYITRARVIHSTPIIETVYEQREVCKYSYVDERSRQQGAVGDKLVGGLLGGAAGSAVGKGSGRDVAAGIGALVGSEIAAQDGGISEGELIGGIAGGVIGNQVGGGSGKTAATAAGVLLGSIVGDNLQNGGKTASAGETRKKKVRVCETQEVPKKIITGYDVMFEHDSYQFSQILSHEPGAYVDINVNVEVLEERTGLR